MHHTSRCYQLPAVHGVLCIAPCSSEFRELYSCIIGEHSCALHLTCVPQNILIGFPLT